MSEPLQIEVVFALRGQQELINVTVRDGATVAEVISASGLAERFPGEALHNLQTGVWGHPVAPDHCVRSGDRVELYRPLQRDPRDARRALARAGLTMSEPDGD